jgi:hypothetical protein
METVRVDDLDLRLDQLYTYITQHPGSLARDVWRRVYPDLLKRTAYRRIATAERIGYIYSTGCTADVDHSEPYGCPNKLHKHIYRSPKWHRFVADTYQQHEHREGT